MWTLIERLQIVDCESTQMGSTPIRPTIMGRSFSGQDAIF
jgi:hypothetical protein